MKKLLFIPIFMFGVNFSDIQNDITNSLIYKISQKKIEIYKQKLKIMKSKNYGSLDLKYDAIHMFNQPYSYIHTIQGTTTAYLSDKNHFIGEIKYSYPIFSGFAISNMINKSKLELIKEQLNLKNTKRVLLLEVSEIYGNIYAIKKNIEALKSAKKSLYISKEKAISFYNSGLLDKSKVEEIKAKYYEVLADIKNLENQKNSLLDTLSYILNKKISKIDGIKIEKITSPSFDKRVDVKVLKQTLKIANKEIKIAKAENYPTIGIEVGLKKEADNLGLNENKYQNINKSYIALELNYNIFSGGETKAKIELAKLAKDNAILIYNNYLNKIKTEYDNDLNNFEALKYQLKAAKKEILARKEYYDYIQAKFNEGLVDSSDLNDAITKLSQSKAKKDSIKAKLFILSIKLKLNGGNDE
jgi:outer membrane protein TolC